jgi:hypothetical protein
MLTRTRSVRKPRFPPRVSVYDNVKIQSLQIQVCIILTGIDMSESPSDIAEKRFILLAVRRANPTVLLQMNLPWERLVTDIVTPYDLGELFFVDGAPVKATDLDRLKILLQSNGFTAAFARLNWHLRTGDTKSKEMHAKQYPILIEAMLREHCIDVTSQVISAFRTAIKPRLRDHMPDRAAFLDAGIKLLVEGMKAWSSP